MIEGAKKLEHTTKLFKKNNCLKFKDLIKMKTTIYGYKASKGSLPYDLQKQFMRANQVHNYRTRNCDNLYLKPYKCSPKGKCPGVLGSNYFNDLPVEMQNKKTISSFKSNLKKMYINSY